MRKLLLFAVVLAATIVLAAEPETIDQLKQRAAAAKDGDQPKLFLEVAERQLKAADSAYSQGNAEQAKAAINDVGAYCERAAAAATSTHKHLKHTEIKIRDLARRLGSMLRVVSFDDREPLQAAIDRIEKARSGLY